MAAEPVPLVPLPGQLPLPFKDDDQGDDRERKRARPPTKARRTRDGEPASAPSPFIDRTPRETFRMVPDRLWMDRRLTGSDVRLWCVLAFHARDRAYSDATDDTLADLMGLCPRSVREGLARLQDCQFITRHGRGSNRTITLRPEGDGAPIPGLIFKVVG